MRPTETRSDNSSVKRVAAEWRDIPGINIA